MKQLFPRSIKDQIVRIPGSKSISHRMMICAALGPGTSVLANPLESEDLDLTRAALTAMGADIRKTDDTRVQVTGFNGQPRPWNRPIFLGNSGTSMRLLAGIAALGTTPYILTGDDRMCERPMGELLDALNRLGISAESESAGGTPPVTIHGTRRNGGTTRIDCSKSSQYLSSLLMMGALLDNGLTIDLTGPPVSVPYIDLTLDVMNQFGVIAQRLSTTRYQVGGNQTYAPGAYTIEPDLSNAGYFWAMGAITGQKIGVDNIGTTSLQGDLKQIHILERMGCRVTCQDNAVAVRGQHLCGIDVDMGDTPDAVPAIAMVAAFAQGVTRIRNIGHLRVKECDRIEAVSSGLMKMGIHVDQGHDFMEITGGTPKGAFIPTYNDHRIAMAFSLAGLMIEGMTIENPDCVKKSFPGYWEIYDRLK